MAASASIPAAAQNTGPRDSGRTVSFQRSRPKSRVVILSNRPPRVQHPAGRFSTAARLPCPKPANDASDINPRSHRTNVPATNVRSSHLPSRVAISDAGSSFDTTWELSEPSVDLDLFPAPPNVSLNRHKCPTVADDVPSGPATAINSRKPACVPKHVPSPRPRMTAAKYKSPRSSRGWLLDGAADLASASKHASIDSALVEAITRSICQQLRLFAVAANGDRGARSPKKSTTAPTDQYASQSRAPKRRESIDHFTEELQRYAEKNKVPRNPINPISTPTKSSASFRTISPLLPFRPEFKAAGLAVTSNEQRYRFPSYITKAIASRSARRRQRLADKKKPRVPRFDGHEEKDQSLSSDSAMFFAPSQDMDDWRYALIEEAPIRKQKRQRTKKKSKRNCCLSCFVGDEDSIPDGEWSHFRRISKTPMPRPQRDAPPTPPPKPSPLALPDRSGRGNQHRSGADSVPRSPRRRYTEPNQAGKREATSAQSKSAFRTTGLRRPSMTLPRDKPYLEAYHGGHYDGEPICKEKSRLQTHSSRAKTVQSSTTRQLNAERERSQYQRPYQSLPARNIAEMLPKMDQSSAASVDEWSPTRPTKASKPGQKSRQPFDPDHIGVCCRSGRGLSTAANARPNIPRRVSSIRGSLRSTDAEDYDDGKIIDRDVLRGLHIAASAACDEQVDDFVRGTTGLRIRRFLADLMMLETMRDVQSGEDSGQGANRRSLNMRKLKRQVRQSREMRKSGIAT